MADGQVLDGNKIIAQFSSTEEFERGSYMTNCLCSYPFVYLTMLMIMFDSFDVDCRSTSKQNKTKQNADYGVSQH